MITAPEIREAFDYAEIAYKDQRELSSLFGRSITIIDPILPGLGDACYIIDEAERAVVMFPGSSDIKDWIFNLDYHRDDGFHAGFRRDLDRMASKIMDRLAEIDPDDILITGHSRGGALADVFLEQHCQYLDASIDCITFAQPRIATFKHYQSKKPVKEAGHVRYLRVHTADDIVPHLPPRRFGFTHYGRAKQIGSKMSWLDRVKYFLHYLLPGKKAAIVGLKSHVVGTYRQHVKNL